MKRIQALLIAVGVCAAVAGLLRGESAEIFRKAERVCLECIGIG